MAEFLLSERLVGSNHPPLVIAEIGINHGGSLDTAIGMADAAINSGAEVVKHQTHIISDEMSSEARSVVPGNADISIYEIMRRCALCERDEWLLMQHIESQGAIFLSTPFSRAAADRLMRFQVKAVKIGSGECNNYPLVRHICKAGVPIILSTGMNSIESIRPSVEIIRKAGLPYALLHCTNIYPTPSHLVRLGAMSQLSDEYPDAVIGLSDHTLTNHACFGAVALGASILERHFTDSKERVGPDIICSMDPAELYDLIKGTDIIRKALGGEKEPLAEEAPTIAFAFASVVVTKDLAAGDLLTEDNLWLRRPGGGDFGPKDYDQLLGRAVISPVSCGERLTHKHLS